MTPVGLEPTQFSLVEPEWRPTARFCLRFADAEHDFAGQTHWCSVVGGLAPRVSKIARLDPKITNGEIRCFFAFSARAPPSSPPPQSCEVPALPGRLGQVLCKIGGGGEEK